jgi:hypothetical protein
MTRIHSLFGGVFLGIVFTANSTQAAITFEPLSSIRRINIGATVGVFATDDSGFSDVRSQGDGRSIPGYGYADEAVGLSGFGFSTPYGGGGGSGRASQQSEMTGERIYFNGFADVYVAASSGADGYASASGTAASDFSYSFRLVAATNIRLNMSSGAVDETTSEYTFSIYNDNGTLVWDQIGIETNLMYLTTFSVDLPLEAGDYTVNSHVAASSSYEGDFGWAGQSRAEFTMTPVPEPGTALLSAVGCVLAAGVRWKRRTDNLVGNIGQKRLLPEVRKMVVGDGFEPSKA